jgi:outer membrane protein assembly factor BamA
MIHSVVRTGGDALAQARFRQLEATTFEPSRVRRMTDALRESYVQEGRLDARVEAKQRPHARGVDVCVALDPGPKITIAKLEFPGRRSISQKALVAVLPDGKVNRVGGIYDEAALEYAEWYILAAYWDRGFAEVQVKDPVVKRRGKRLDVAIPIDEGPVYRIGQVATNLPGGVRFGVKRGDVFARSKIADALAKLNESLREYRATVIPVTKLDRETRTIDLTFEVTWRWPWDSVRYLLSRSR